jgi:septal ring factor EnvC (AmiA/AmiB activator)
MISSLESKEAREQVSHWLEDGQRQLSVLLGLLNDYDRLLELAEASERENERLRGLNYEIEQVRNRLETSERQSDQLREEVHRLRTETERHRKEREEVADSITTFMNEVLGRLRPQPA